MGLGAFTILEDKASVGPLKVTRFTVVGDGSYPTGGSVGLEAALRAAASGERRHIVAVLPIGNNGDSHLEHTPRGAEQDCTAVATTDLFSTPVAHGFSAGDAVRFYKKGNGNANLPDAALPGGLSEDTVYYVIATGLTTTAFEVSTTVGGAAVNLTSNGAHFVVQKEDKLLVRVMSTAAEVANATNLSGTTYTGLALSV